MKYSELISVIVPAYNVQDYLRECLDSLICQTYDNLEILIINDGSKDNTESIAKEYTLKDKRIKLINKENGGLSDARNMALDIMKGKYLTFVDSDDYLAEDTIEIMYNDLINSGSEISCVANIQELDKFKQGSGLNVYTRDEAIDRYLLGLYSEASCGKLYKAEIFKDIRFPYKKIHEDTFTTYKVLSKINKTAVNNYNGYYYRVRNDSITNLLYSDKNYDKVEACRIIYEYYKGGSHEYRAYNKYLSALLYFIVKTNNRDVAKNKVAKDELKKILEDNGYKGIRMKLLPFMIAYRLGLLNHFAKK